MRTGSGEKREKKRKGERMRGIALWRIFEFCWNIQPPCFCRVVLRRIDGKEKCSLHDNRKKCHSERAGGESKNLCAIGAICGLWSQDPSVRCACAGY